MILHFGDYQGTDLSSPEIPDSYICYLSKPTYKTKDEPRIPFDVKMAARDEAERRGWELIGETWSKNGQVATPPILNSLKQKKNNIEKKIIKKVCRNCERENKIIGDGISRKVSENGVDPSTTKSNKNKDISNKCENKGSASNLVEKQEVGRNVSISDITALDMVIAERNIYLGRIAKLEQVIEILQSV